MTLFIDTVPEKGFAVFASKDFKKGDIIERCPVVILPENESEMINDTVLNDYQFAWGDDEKKGAICLGYGSIYNHHPEPNADFDMDYDSRWIVFKAIKDIKKGEEICVNYEWGLDDAKTPEWYKKMHADHAKKHIKEEKDDCDC